MPLPLAAERHYAYQQNVAAAAVRGAQLAWSKVSLRDLDGSWRAVSGGLLALVTAAQIAAARDADPYLSAVLAEMGQPDDPAGQVQPAAFAGIASDGRGLASLLDSGMIAVKVALAAQVAPAQALTRGANTLEMVTQTTIQDTGRAAVSAGIVARPHVSGYVRVLTLPSCSRCAILAGRVYRWSTGFERHPRCFPAGTVVSGPAHEAATRRWYEGELVVIRTAGGKELSATGNHPVLTDRGWVPANLLQEGDQVVGGSVGDQGAHALVVPDEHQMPARIEDLWRAGDVSTLRRVPTSAEDFHGDGGHGEVDVVLADRLLRHYGQPALHERFAEQHFARRVVSPGLLDELGAGSLELVGVMAPSVGADLRRLGDKAWRDLAGRAGGVYGLAPDRMSVAELRETLLAGHLGSSIESSRGTVADRHASSFESWADARPRDVEALAEVVLALAGLVGGDDLTPGDIHLGSRWDAPALPLSVENAGAYAGRGVDLLHRLAGQVELDRVVELRRVQWSGHVYNLSSVEGWYNANGLIVSNCDCRMIPASEDVAKDLTTDPREYFKSLSAAEQDKTFTKAGAESVRLGADLNQIVNARRGALGLTPAGARLTREEQKTLRYGLDRGRLKAQALYGQPVYVTTEGVTRRGVAGSRLGAWEDGVKKPGQRYHSASTARIMPETILQIAENREDAIRLLKRYGFVL